MNLYKNVKIEYSKILCWGAIHNKHFVLIDLWGQAILLVIYETKSVNFSGCNSYTADH